MFKKGSGVEFDFEEAGIPFSSKLVPADLRGIPEGRERVRFLDGRNPVCNPS